jgi:DNA-binding NtrC family response regulator
MSAPHILIVSADVEAGELYAMQLVSLPARTTWFPDCAAARRFVDGGQHCDVVLFDIGRLADWDDCVALAAAMATTPVIVVTGWIAMDRRYQQRAFDAGCAAFVAKPCTAGMLRAAVSRVRQGERRVELVDYTDAPS